MKHLLIVIILLFVFCFNSYADVTYQTHASTGFIDLTTTATLTGFTISSGTNCVLFVGVTLDSNTPGDNSAVVWDLAGVNESLTSVLEVNEATHAAYVRVWRRINPTPGSSKTITETHNGQNSGTLFAIVFCGVDQTTPVRGTASASSAGSAFARSSTLSPTSANGDMGLSVLQVGEASPQNVTACAPAGSETERMDLDANANGKRGCAYQLASSGSLTIGSDWTAGSTQDTTYAHVAISVQAAITFHPESIMLGVTR